MKQTISLVLGASITLGLVASEDSTTRNAIGKNIVPYVVSLDTAVQLQEAQQALDFERAIALRERWYALKKELES